MIKKQPLIGIASALAVTIGLASVSFFADADVSAASRDYGIWVGTTKVTPENKDDILAGDENNTGLAKYDPETGILSLDGVKITEGSEQESPEQNRELCEVGIYSTYDIMIEGTVEISGVDIGIFVWDTLYSENGLTADIDVETTGLNASTIDLPDSTIDISINDSVNGVAIIGITQVEFDNSKVNVSGCAMGISAGALKVENNTEIDITSVNTAICAFESAYFENCNVTLKHTGEERGDKPRFNCGIYSNEISFNSGSVVNIESNIVAVFGEYDVEFVNCDADIKGVKFAISSEDRISISDSKVIAEADEYAIIAAGVLDIKDKILVPQNGKVLDPYEDLDDDDEYFGIYVMDADGKAATSVLIGAENFGKLPDVTGKNYEEAEKELSDYFTKTGLTIDIQRGWVDNNNSDNNLLVASMQPAAGTVVDANTKTVTVYVYEGYNPTPVSTEPEPTKPESTEPETDETENTESADKVAAFVERLYNVVLGRDSEADGAAFWTKELKSLKCTGAEVAQGFIFSKEFTDKNLSDKDFVTVLYKAFFDRDPDTDGLNYWVGLLENKTSDRTAVANGFIFSKEWADTCKEYGIKSGANTETDKELTAERVNAFVERMYTTALGRESDKDGAAYWVEQLTSKKITGEQLGLSFFLSEELTKANLSDKEFVDRLYLTFMNREAESEGETYWIGILKEGTSRKDVVLGFTRSAEFTDRCTEADILPF